MIFATTSMRHCFPFFVCSLLFIVTSAIAAPVNDLFRDAVPISGSTGQVTATNIDASREIGEKDHAGSTGGSSVWWSWTSPNKGQVSFFTTGSNFDTILAVYRGNSVSSLAEIASNDDESDASLTSTVSFDAFEGVTYHIVVDGYDGDSGNIVLTWSNTVPENDDFANRISLIGESGKITTSNANASREFSEPDFFGIAGGHSLWWSWTAPRSGYVTFSTYHSTFNTLLGVFIGNSFTSLEIVTANDNFDPLLTFFSKKKSGRTSKYIPENPAFMNEDLTSTVNFYAEKGQEYQIGVDGIGDSLGTLTLNWFIEDPPAGAPANDHFENRIILNEASGQTTGSNIFATRQIGESFHAENTGGRSLWWSWMAPSSGMVTFDTAESGFDTIMAVYTGSSISSLTEIVSNDDIGALVASRVSFRATAGTVYHIAVDGYDGDFGNVTLNWSNEIPVNDDFANRISLSGSSGETTGTNINAGVENAEALISDSHDHSVWWSWTATESGLVVFETIGSDFNTLLAIFSGDVIQSLNILASNVQGDNKRVSFNATAGRSYSILVGGKEGEAGNILLQWNSGAPSNDYFADRISLEGLSGQTTGSSIGATREAREPDHADTDGEHSVWWSWSAPSNAKMTFDTHGSSYDTALAVYQGSTINGLTLIEENDDDDAFGGYTSAVTFQAQEGITYSLAVDGYNGDTGTITLNWSIMTPEIRVEPLELTFLLSESSSSSNAFTTTKKTQIAAKANSGKTNPKEPSIYFKTGTISDNQTNSVVSKVSAKVKDSSIPRHVLIQFDRIPTQSEKRRLAAQGIQLLRYIPDNAYWASIQPKSPSLSAVSEGGGIQKMLLSEEIDKLCPDAASGNFPSNTRLENGNVEVRAVVFEDIGPKTARTAFYTVGAKVLGRISETVYRLAVNPLLLRKLSSLDIVEWVEAGPPPFKPTNATAALRSHTSETYNPPYALSGAGVLVGVWDDGVVFNHQDFGSRLHIMNSGGDASDHGTHVAGTIGGSGRGNLSAKGMAPEVELYTYDWEEDINEMRDAADFGLRISNHSYGYTAGWEKEGDKWRNRGDFLFGVYNTYSYAWDQMVWDTGILTFRSASNDRDHGPDWPYGPRMDGPYHTLLSSSSKNGISVGATTDDDRMSTFSSWGPTDDGRIKPDLCMNGTNLTSTVLDDEYDDSFSGTSMASPAAAGAAALLYQLYQIVTVEEPNVETMKAFMIHGAKDLGNPGPDYAFGWGLIDTRESADLILGHMWNAGTVNQGETITYTVHVPNGEHSIKATLVWTDAASSPAAAKSLVNDLDLILRSPSGTVYYPWVLDPENPSANATKGINTIDNVEQVLIENPESGEWTIEISGTTIAEHEGRYALVSELLSDTKSTDAFWIYNDGKETLTVDSITFENEVTDAISFTPRTSFNVAPASYRKVSVTVDYSKLPEGTTSTRLMISSNDPDPEKNPYPDGVLLHFTPEVRVKDWVRY